MQLFLQPFRARVVVGNRASVRGALSLPVEEPEALALQIS